MTPARKCRLALAMTALAAYPACAAEQAELADEPTTTTMPERHNPQASDPTALDWDGVARIAKHQADARAARSRPRPTPAASIPAPRAGGDVWGRLAACESGNRNDGGAPYYGFFQFSARTWQSLGYTGTADQYPYATQLEGAKRLQARSGWSQWPACSRKLGLR